MEEFVKKDYTEVIEAIESGMLDTSDIDHYMDIILHALYVCRNQCTDVVIDLNSIPTVNVCGFDSVNVLDKFDIGDWVKKKDVERLIKQA